MLEVVDGVGAHQAQAGGLGVAVERALVLRGGGVDGGDAGAEGGEACGVPTDPGSEVQDAKAGHVTEHIDAGTGLRDVPGPAVQLRQIEGPAELMTAVKVPDLADALLDVQHEVLPFVRGADDQGRRA
ncbi:hypothetical protein EES45_33995 [Streptomyces sp. ADI97-07]|nr:hypothetical protein EES45_33995 [Streptomyces sp. ADI97-07]